MKNTEIKIKVWYKPNKAGLAAPIGMKAWVLQAMHLCRTCDHQVVLLLQFPFMPKWNW